MVLPFGQPVPFYICRNPGNLTEKLDPLPKKVLNTVHRSVVSRQSTASAETTSRKAAKKPSPAPKARWGDVPPQSLRNAQRQLPRLRGSHGCGFLQHCFCVHSKFHIPNSTFNCTLQTAQCTPGAVGFRGRRRFLRPKAVLLHAEGKKRREKKNKNGYGRSPSKGTEKNRAQVLSCTLLSY